MSELRNNFMATLDAWTKDNVITPLLEAASPYAEVCEDIELMEEVEIYAEAAGAQVKKAIREKVLESYRNGQNARPRGKERPYSARK
jgi:hypothetical protein